MKKATLIKQIQKKRKKLSDHTRKEIARYNKDFKNFMQKEYEKTN